MKTQPARAAYPTVGRIAGPMALVLSLSLLGGCAAYHDDAPATDGTHFLDWDPAFGFHDLDGRTVVMGGVVWGDGAEPPVPRTPEESHDPPPPVELLAAAWRTSIPGAPLVFLDDLRSPIPDATLARYHAELAAEPELSPTSLRAWTRYLTGFDLLLVGRIEDTWLDYPDLGDVEFHVLGSRHAVVSLWLYDRQQARLLWSCTVAEEREGMVKQHIYLIKTSHGPSRVGRRIEGPAPAETIAAAFTRCLELLQGARPRP